jgi:hypothetical protein
MRRLACVFSVALLATAFAGVAPVFAATAAPAAPAARPASSSPCTLSNGIQHVIYVQFDNTHLFRDRPQFASDLEQMPNLLNFLKGNGTLSDNEHTILISHTAGGILSSLTGLYPDRNGITVSNSYRYFLSNGSTASSAAFKYWTDLVDDANGTADPLPNMVTDSQKNTPAPWVPYTRAGCDFGAVATANTVLENTGTGAFGDMTKVFGANSPEWNEAKATPGLAQTDFVGIGVHCGKDGGICAGNSNARPDQLPDEPGGYNGFQGLFGAKYVNPAITGGAAAVKDLTGAPITDPSGNPGFPGFDGMLASVSLGYMAQMQEAGVPVTFAYISDAHDAHPTGPAYGPGEAGYLAALKAYDDAFGTFFKRLAADGIDQRNTLFVFTADENDHLAGGNSTDGTWSHTFCAVSLGESCPPNQIGEVNQNMRALVPQGSPAFTVHSDSAPTVYVTGNPAPSNPDLRQLERNLAAARAVDPYLGPDPQPVMLYMADPAGEKALHMVNTDPQRTPTFTYFANSDYFLYNSTTNSACPDAAHAAATCIDYHFAWSHGDATEDVGRTWLGLVGPGVRKLGRTSEVWSDHPDIRPTMLELLGLKDSYELDGRVLQEFLKPSAISKSLREHNEQLVRLAVTYKQIDAPFNSFAHNVLVASTRGLASGSAAEDSKYQRIESRISSLTADRDALAAKIRTVLNDAAFAGRVTDNRTLKQLNDQGGAILDRSAGLADTAE